MVGKSWALNVDVFIAFPRENQTQKHGVRGTGNGNQSFYNGLYNRSIDNDLVYRVHQYRET